ncbi:hypothetical protein FPY71_01735 [Aureimonas fodinaquatilis]|uniref:Uncharacterized protein n=1 Tax=Aureimonas fodinaquatilis TaxID=2565783 RepID=A0A5B0E174_9HYPH|nr:hypothetical protein [Aureimonas fodinaquatilis]KAA0971875.1 hypothetical protein FPY71_01735 [Aureimonas fodinaquatilis]
MNKQSWRIFLHSAINNRRTVGVYCCLEAIFLWASTAFSLVIAMHFGFGVFGLQAHPLLARFISNQELMLLAAMALACTAFGSRLAISLLESRLISASELALARSIRRINMPSASEDRTVTRASNYYGRLSLASMKAFGSATILLLNFLLLPMLITWQWALIIAVIFTLSAIALYLAFIRLAARMQSSASDLLTHSREVARWKLDAGAGEPDALQIYFRAYSNRIFLASVFSHAAWLFALLFTLAIAILHFLKIQLSPGEAFVAFMLMQLYLGLVSRMFSSFISSAAFAPSVLQHHEAVFAISPDQPSLA